MTNTLRDKVAEAIRRRWVDNGGTKDFADAALKTIAAELLNPDMPAQELRLHMGEITSQEERTARSAIRWANSRVVP